MLRQPVFPHGTRAAADARDCLQMSGRLVSETWLALLSPVWNYLKTVISHQIVMVVELFALASHCQFPCALYLFGMPSDCSGVQGAGPQNVPHCTGQAEGLCAGAGRIFWPGSEMGRETPAWDPRVRGAPLGAGGRAPWFPEAWERREEPQVTALRPSVPLACCPAMETPAFIGPSVETLGLSHFLGASRL